ncbi:hypothetical protein OSTOST_03126 [Ostertagia ostertagi]
MDFSPGGATRAPQTVIDLGAVPSIDNFGFYDSGGYETTAAGTHQFPSVCFKVVSWILTMWFCGGFIVYFIARALGGDVGYSQVLGVVGYCLIPLVVTGFLMTVVARFVYISYRVEMIMRSIIKPLQ